MWGIGLPLLEISFQESVISDQSCHQSSVGWSFCFGLLVLGLAFALLRLLALGPFAVFGLFTLWLALALVALLRLLALGLAFALVLRFPLALRRRFGTGRDLLLGFVRGDVRAEQAGFGGSVGQRLNATVEAELSAVERGDRDALRLRGFRQLLANRGGRRDVGSVLQPGVLAGACRRGERDAVEVVD